MKKRPQQHLQPGLNTTHNLELFGIKFGAVKSFTELPPTPEPEKKPLLAPIHADGEMAMRSAWSMGGLILEWHKPIPTVPDYIPYKTPLPLKVGRVAGFGIYTGGLTASAMTESGAGPAAIVGFGSGAAVISSYFYELAKIKLQNWRYDRKAKQIETEAAAIMPEFGESRVLERAAGMEHAFQIDDRTYKVSGEAAKLLIESRVTIPHRETTIPAATVMAEFQKLDQTPRADIYTAVGSKVEVPSIQTSRDSNGLPVVSFNPARGLAHLLQIANVEDGEKVLGQSLASLSTLFTEQGRIANLNNQQALAQTLAVRDTEQAQSSFTENSNDETIRFAQNFLQIGAAYMAGQPSYRQTALES